MTKNLIKKLSITAIAFSGLLLGGCASKSSPDDLRLTTSGNGYDGGLMRGFVFLHSAQTVKEQEVRIAADVYLFDGSDDDKAELSWFHSPYEPHSGKFFSNMRYPNSFLDAGNNWMQAPHMHPALGIQSGDLVDFHSRKITFVGVGMPMFNAVRVVCKFYDESCIEKERRDYFCKDGLMEIDGVRREDKPCGGWGASSEVYAAIVGPVDELYGSLDNYFKVHNVPYGQCLVTDMSCGHEEGKSIERGKYDEFLQRFPNYLPAQKAATKFSEEKMHKDGDTPFRDWAIYLSKHMFDKEPVELTPADFGVTESI